MISPGRESQERETLEETMKIKLQLQPVYKTTPLTIPARLIEQIGCKRQLLQRNILPAEKWPFGSIGIANSSFQKIFRVKILDCQKQFSYSNIWTA